MRDDDAGLRRELGHVLAASPAELESMGTEARRVALEISDEYVASAMYDGIQTGPRHLAAHDGSQRGMKILLSAFECEPGKGSEAGVGWGIAWALAKNTGSTF